MDKETDITLLKKYSDREIIKRNIEFMKPVAGRFIFGIILILFNVLLNILMPRMIGRYMDIIELETMTENSLTQIIVICASYLIIVVLNMILTYFQTVIIQRAGQTVIFNIRQKVFEKIESFSHEQLSEIPIGKLVTRVNNDTNALNELYSNVVVNLLKYSLTIIGISINMILLNPILAGYMGIFIIIIVIATLIYRHYSKIAFKEERKQLSNLNSFLSENLSGMRITQIFNQEKRKHKEFSITNQKLVKAKRNVMFVFSFYRPTISFLYFTAVGVVFLVGFPMVKENKEFFGQLFTFGMLTSFYNYTVSFFGPVQHLAEQFDRLQSGIVSSSRIFNILDMESTIKQNETAIKVDSFKGKIEFKNVWFAYKNDDWILKDVSFVINHNQTVAFVGATGAGKTTILSLIVRNYDIQKGHILIDDIDIMDIDINSLRSKIGQMLQDVFIFSGTVRDNITLRNENIKEDEVLSAMKYVNADAFISKLPQGLNTEVSERGANFSSGQRQLISFARTVVSKPQILILDEATANIDTETETLIQKSLEKMKSIGTMLVVAHRLSTIQHADNIICLNKGVIQEHGTHQQLLKKKGYYYKLYQLQFSESGNKNLKN